MRPGRASCRAIAPRSSSATDAPGAGAAVRWRDTRYSVWRSCVQWRDGCRRREKGSALTLIQQACVCVCLY
jgi:hypothetical protein